MWKWGRRCLSLSLIAVLSCYLVISSTQPAYGMHVMEGFLPIPWAVFWWLVTLPFLIFGMRSLARLPGKIPI